MRIDPLLHRYQDRRLGCYCSYYSEASAIDIDASNLRDACNLTSFRNGDFLTTRIHSAD